MPLVIATKKGFYLCERYPGDEFDVPAGMTGSWFKEPAIAKAELKKSADRAAGKGKHEPKTFAELAQQDKGALG